ncbi:MAG: type IV pilus biogenesis protein PilM [Pseudomonadota bacterium]
MWSSWIVVGMVSLGSYYILVQSSNTDSVARASLEVGLADSMAIYRDSVIKYAHDHPEAIGRVANENLSYPTWRPRPPTDRWANYIDEGGIITVYAQKLPAVSITAEIAALSHDSAMAGQFNGTNGEIDTPSHRGERARPPALPAGNVIPDKAPVWLAVRN